jgi:dGTPase
VTVRSSPDRAGYDHDATARWAAEPPKRAAAPGFEPGRFGRGPFERDRARVLHTSALRRLAAKTQVVEVDAGDFPRTRLTHSLECAQIGRELGGALGCDPDLVDTACLAHDLGHPPFGHNGESALADVAAACGGFEGNAQSLRLLTRLEAKVPGAGLNLTRATLDATLKYPWLAGPGLPLCQPGGATPRTPRKYGAYADDAAVFAWIRDGAPPARPSLEAQVMDWADDVAYSVHDLEDGLHAGLTRLSALADPGERKAISQLTADQYCAPGSVSPDELAEVFDDLLALPCWPDGFDGGPRSLAALKNLTSELIGRLCGAAYQATMDASGGRPLTRYDADLQVPRRQRLECALLKGVTAYYVMSRAGAAQTQARERELIMELAAAVRIGAPGTLDAALRPAYEAAQTDAGRLRVVVDQVATLTDTSAVAWHARLCR